MGAEVHSALYGTRGWAGKRATLEQTLSTPSHRAFPLKVSHPKGFRNTILESPTTVFLRRSNEHQRAPHRSRRIRLPAAQDSACELDRGSQTLLVRNGDGEGGKAEKQTRQTF